MNDATVRTLSRLNRDFYRARAAEFSATRRAAWPGWRHALDVYRGRSPVGGVRSLLDLGCGNGRFGASVAPALGSDHRYLGLDESPALLAAARRFPEQFPGARFAAVDLVSRSWPLVDGRGGFSWIVAFGLLHHVPGRRNRRRLIRRLARALAPGGLATVSFWRFANRRRFRRRMVDWPDVGAAQLEPGDHFLRWGSGDDLRYCHHADDAEVDELTRAAGLEVVERYRSDGEDDRLNLYLLLARAAEPRPAAAAGG